MVVSVKKRRDFVYNSFCINICKKHYVDNICGLFGLSAITSCIDNNNLIRIIIDLIIYSWKNNK